MSTRGIFDEGRFRMCGDGSRGVPQCMGRAARDDCTCPTFTAAEMAFAKEHKLSIETSLDMPIEWRARRGARVYGPQAWSERGSDDRCLFCGNDGPVIRGPEPATICEPCARFCAAEFGNTREFRGERRLVSVPGGRS